jgi:tRNA-dihydrouridine synthase A
MYVSSGKGAFGAALMREADLVADICAAMNDGSTSSSSSSSCVVSVKCRIGVDNNDSYEQLHEFVRTVGERGGVQHFIVHARKAILKGLSPDQNRKIPPLKVSQLIKLMLITSL